MKLSPSSRADRPRDVRGLVEEALARPADYAPTFTAEVGRLREALATALNAPVEHDPDMNYAAGQSLRVPLDDDGSPARDAQQAAYRMVAYVSSRGPLFTVVHLRRSREWAGAGQLWERVTEADLPPAATGCGEVLRETLAAHGRAEVPSALADQPAPGHVTEMDGAPASVFDALFTELVA